MRISKIKTKKEITNPAIIIKTFRFDFISYKLVAYKLYSGIINANEHKVILNVTAIGKVFRTYPNNEKSKDATTITKSIHSNVK